MTYAFSCLGTLPFCILFHELEVDSQVNYVSIFSLTTYSVCTVSCELRGSKVSSRACVTPFPWSLFSPLPCSQEKKNPDCRLPAASTYWEPCVSIYCTGLLYGLLYLKNKQVDISTSFCFSETISWLTSVTVLIMMKLLLCQTARMPLLPFLSQQRLIGLYLSCGDHCRVSPYLAEWTGRGLQKKRERDKRELDLSKKPKVLVSIDKIKELFPETCCGCGGAISLKQTMSGAVLTLQWNCDSGHFDTWTSSDVLTERNNQKVYVNNFQMAAAITQWK